MEYLVIELDTVPHIITINEVNITKTHIEGRSGNFNNGGEPVIFKDKNTAYRIATECRKGLVYPIFDVMKTLETIKLKMKSGDYYSDLNAVEELLNMLNEVV